MIIFTIFLLVSCSTTQLPAPLKERTPASGMVSNCMIALQRFMNSSRGREYSFSHYSHARAELDRVILENNLNLPQLIERGQLITTLNELGVLSTAEEKVALFDKILPFQQYTRISDFTKLTADQTEEMNQIMQEMANWSFDPITGINRIQLDRYLLHLKLMGKDDARGLLGFWYKIYGNPSDVIYDWYIDTLYREGMMGLMGKFYQGNTNLTRMIGFRNAGARIIGTTFKSLASAAAVILDVLPLGQMNRINIDPDKMDRWLTTPYHEIADEMHRELRLRANLQLSKNLTSHLLVIAGIGTIGYTVYHHFAQDTFDRNSQLFDFEVQMMANELARYMSVKDAARDEILSALESREREDATMVQTATDLWIEQQARTILNTMDRNAIEREWNNYLQEQY